MLLIDIDSDVVIFFSNHIGLNNISVNNINLDDDNFDDYGSETINHIRSLAGIIDLNKTKDVKQK